MNDKNKELGELLSIAAIIDERELPEVIERLSALEENPETLSTDVVFEEGSDVKNNDAISEEADLDFENMLKSKNVDSSVLLYIRDVGEISKMYPILSREEEIELAKKMKKGNKYAREKLINSNLRLVIYNARKFINKGVGLADLIQEGNEGLCLAAEKFDYTKSFRFSTYATWWILQRIRRAVLEKDGIIRIPPHVFYKTKKINQAIEDYKKKHDNKVPSYREISEITGLALKTVKNILHIPECTTSLNAPLESDSDTSLSDIVSDNNKTVEDIVDEHIMAEKFDEAIECLTDREKYVVINYYRGGKSLQEIGFELGVMLGKKRAMSRERVRQIRNEACLKLKDQVGIKEYEELFKGDYSVIKNTRLYVPRGSIQNYTNENSDDFTDENEDDSE